MGNSFTSDSFFQRLGRRTARTLFFLITATWVVVGNVQAGAARAEASREYELKAVLVFNLTRFVEWPNDAFANAEAPLVIGILGMDPFGQNLEDVVRSESFGRHKIMVVRYRTIEAVRNCHILYVGTDERPNLPRILRQLEGRPILTVGEYEGFATGGGMIRIYQSPDGKIRLRINLGAVRGAGLTVSGKLLRVAETINTGKD